MKVLKMHNDAEEQFDLFVKQRLDGVEVDTALAKHYFKQMDLPPVIEPPVPPAAAGRRRRWFLLLLLCCVTGVAGYVLLRHNKQVSGVLPQQQTTQPTMPVAAPETEATADKAANNGATDTASAAPPNSPPLPGRVPMPGGEQAASAGNNKAIVPGGSTNTSAGAAPAPDSAARRVSSPTDQLQAQTTARQAAIVDKGRADTVSGKIKPKHSIPNKPADSVYIIW